MHGNYFRITTVLCHLTAVLEVNFDYWMIAVIGDNIPDVSTVSDF